MKVTFQGWDRSVHTYKRAMTPLTKIKNGYTVGQPGTAMQWASDGLTAYAKIEKLSLSGNFLVKLEMQRKELSNWLMTYAKEKPEAVLKIVAEAQAEEMIALAKNSGNSAPE